MDPPLCSYVYNYLEKDYGIQKKSKGFMQDMRGGYVYKIKYYKDDTDYSYVYNNICRCIIQQHLGLNKNDTTNKLYFIHVKLEETKEIHKETQQKIAILNIFIRP